MIVTNAHTTPNEKYPSTIYTEVLSDEEQDNLAEIVNICYNNFTDRLWKKFPTLTKADISLCCLIKIGISNSNMLYLLDTSKVALKKRKNRLKHDKMGMDENDSLDEFIMGFRRALCSLFHPYMFYLYDIHFMESAVSFTVPAAYQ